jgi:hypothetical protein
LPVQLACESDLTEDVLENLEDPVFIEQLIWLLVRDIGVDDGVADFKILQVELRQVLIPAQCTVVTSTIQDRVQVAQT